MFGLIKVAWKITSVVHFWNGKKLTTFKTKMFLPWSELLWLCPNVEMQRCVFSPGTIAPVKIVPIVVYTLAFCSAHIKEPRLKTHAIGQIKVDLPDKIYSC